MKHVIFCLIFFAFVFAMIPLIVKGLETEEKMRRAQVQELFNRP